MILGQAYARVGLLGNPSDLYGGKALSFTIDRKATVTLEDSAQLKIESKLGTDTTLAYTGINDLVKATLNILQLQDKKLNINYTSDIPISVGLGGSTSIIVATIRALNKHFGLHLDNYQIAELALRTELDELGIIAGFQDRYIISFEGLALMDFTGKEYLKKTDPLGKLEHLPTPNIPFFLCVSGRAQKSTITLSPLREQFLHGSDQQKQDIKKHMDTIADLAVQGKKCIIEEDWKTLGNLMNLNTTLREQKAPHHQIDKVVMQRALKAGALGAKITGSGGCIMVLAEKRNPL